MDIGKLTLDEIRQIQQLTNIPTANDHPYEIGKKYFIRTVTMHLTGLLVAVYPGELVLESAAWIADSGRFSDALKTGSLSEVEPFPNGKVTVGRGSIVDACIWAHDLPREKK
jgi:hypothetical protein